MRYREECVQGIVRGEDCESRGGGLAVASIQEVQSLAVITLRIIANSLKSMLFGIM